MAEPVSSPPPRLGRSVRRFSEGGLAPGKIDNPKALAVDRHGRSMVADGRRLQVFGRTGRFLHAVELPAEVWRDITWIKDLAVDARGFLYVRLVLAGRLWLATGFGLLEAPLDALRPPAGAPPATCSSWRVVHQP